MNTNTLTLPSHFFIAPNERNPKIKYCFLFVIIIQAFNKFADELRPTKKRNKSANVSRQRKTKKSGSVQFIPNCINAKCSVNYTSSLLLLLLCSHRSEYMRACVRLCLCTGVSWYGINNDRQNALFALVPMLFILFKSLQEVSNILINRLTMPNKMVTNVFKSVCFAVCLKQLKSPLCLVSSKRVLSISFFRAHVDLIATKVNIGSDGRAARQRTNQYLFAVCFRMSHCNINKYQGIILKCQQAKFHKGCCSMWNSFNGRTTYHCSSGKLLSKHRTKLTIHSENLQWWLFDRYFMNCEFKIKTAQQRSFGGKFMMMLFGYYYLI